MWVCSLGFLVEALVMMMWGEYMFIGGGIGIFFKYVVLLWGYSVLVVCWFGALVC